MPKSGGALEAENYLEANCAIAKQWPETKEKLDFLYSEINTLGKYLPHLTKLDALEDIKDHLMKAATGRDQIPTQTAMLIVKILGVVIVALLLVLVFLLTGEKLNFLSPGVLNH